MVRSRHVRKLGLLLGAALVLGALVAASASAAELEYRTCVKAAKSGKLYIGKYLNKTCTEEASGAQIAEGKKNKYEAQSAPEETAFTSKTKAATITVGGKTVKCKKGVGSGELTTERFGTTELTLSSCGVNGNKKEPCESPSAGTGVIKTSTLHSGLVFLDEAETKVGILLTNATGDMTIKCGAESFAVKGRLIGSVTNTTKGMTLTFATTGGKQAIQSYWLEEEEFGPFAMFTEKEEEETEATLTVAVEQGPKGVAAV
jgi:hypothetical protein